MFLRREHLAALVVAVSLAASTQLAYAQVDMWQLNGVPLCAAVASQGQPRIVTDGAGGAIVTWQDHRNGTDIGTYAQHVLASGAVDPAWPADGAALSTAAGGYQSVQNIATDGAGGAIVTWEDDFSLGEYNVYAQRVNAAGVVQWTPDGVAICTAVGSQVGPTIVTDGAGGAIITWDDNRSGAYATYAQRVNAAGVAQWTPDGVAISTGQGSRSMTDGAGGAIVTYAKTSSSGTGVYAQHVLASGAMDPAWPAGGRGLCTVPGQGGGSIVTDAAGGAIVAWQDGRNFGHPNFGDPDTYAQRVNAAGVVQWNADGVLLSAAPSYPGQLSVVPDGAGGAIVSWTDERSGIDIYAQRVNAAGVVQWTPDGVAVCTAVGGQGFPEISPDGAGGAIITWDDRRLSGNYDIYAHHVLASGAVDPAWPIDGHALGTGVGDQREPEIVADGARGAIVTWQDGRNGSVNTDIYAQRVSGYSISAVATGEPMYSFAVRAPHPNPANSQATISFDLASPQPVSVRVYDVTGRLVRTLVAGGELPAGSHSLMWSGASDSGTLAHAGIYFIRVSAGSAAQTRRVAIIR